MQVIGTRNRFIHTPYPDAGILMLRAEEAILDLHAHDFLICGDHLIAHGD